MDKLSVNLIIKKEKETRLIKRLKLILPLSALLALIFFVLSFILIIFYINSNIDDFKSTKAKVEQIRQNIVRQQNVEKIYLLTLHKIDAVKGILTNELTFSKAIAKLNSLETEGIDIDKASISQDGDISFSITASSAAALDGFVERFWQQKDSESQVYDLRANSIIRDEKGRYSFTMTGKADKLLSL